MTIEALNLIKEMISNDSEAAKKMIDDLIKSEDLYPLIAQVIIDKPPSKYTLKKKTLNEKGKFDEDVYYLTANLFYSGPHYQVQSKITKAVKFFLVDHFKKVPKMSKMRFEIIYCDTTTQWDLDNKAYFWTKMILDILKTPSSKQILNAHKKYRAIPTVNVIADDTVKFIDEIKMKYKKDEKRMIINLYGILENEQMTLL